MAARSQNKIWLIQRPALLVFSLPMVIVAHHHAVDLRGSVQPFLEAIEESLAVHAGPGREAEKALNPQGHNVAAFLI